MAPIVMPAVSAFSTFSIRTSRSTERPLASPWPASGRELTPEPSVATLARPPERLRGNWRLCLPPSPSKEHESGAAADQHGERPWLRHAHASHQRERVGEVLGLAGIRAEKLEGSRGGATAPDDAAQAAGAPDEGDGEGERARRGARGRGRTAERAGERGAAAVILREVTVGDDLMERVAEVGVLR